MGLLPMGADILPPSDDRVFKLILTPKESKPILMDLISSIIKRTVVDVEVRNSEIPPEDTREKAEKLDVNYAAFQSLGGIHGCHSGRRSAANRLTTRNRGCMALTSASEKRGLFLGAQLRLPLVSRVPFLITA